MIDNQLTIRPEVPADLPAIEAVNTQAFGQTMEANLVNTLRPSLRGPEYSLVASLDGKVVGHILFSPIVIDTGRTAVAAVALAPMAVLPKHQRRGIGSALVKEGLQACRRMGDQIVIVLGHPEFYPRFGFRPASQFGIRAPFEVPDAAFMALELQPGALSEVHGTARYPAAFSGV